MPDPHAVETIGFAAGALTTIAFIPQLLLAVRSRQTHGVSLPMYSLFAFGVALWITYGVFRKSPAVVLTNTVTLLFSGAIISVVLRQRLRPKQRESQAPHDHNDGIKETTP